MKKNSILTLLIVTVLSFACRSGASLSPASGEIFIRGLVISSDVPKKQMTVNVIAIQTQSDPQEVQLSDQSEKLVTWTNDTMLEIPDPVRTGMEVLAVGKNLGKGKPLPARRIQILIKEIEPPAITALEGSENPAPEKPEQEEQITPIAVNSNVKLKQINDPAGLIYAVPSEWQASAMVGANPITFQSDRYALYVRRLPVEGKATPQSRADQAMSVSRSYAIRRGWDVETITGSVGGVRSEILVLTGTISDSDFSKLLGTSKRKITDGPGTIYLAYVSVPTNEGRDPWALEIGIGGMGDDSSVISGMAEDILGSFKWGKKDIKQASPIANPLRSANVAQIEYILKQVGMAAQMFANDNNDKLPANWEDLKNYLHGGPLLVNQLKNGWPNWQVGAAQLLQPGSNLSQIGNPSGTAIAKVEGPGFTVTLFADGHVEKIRN